MGLEGNASTRLANMFLLYNGNSSGSQEARLLEKVHPVNWDLLRRHVVRNLRSLTYDTESADAIEGFPFELWEATNGFGDRFELLYMKIPVHRYLELELEADTYRGKSLYEKIAQAMKEGGNPIRFIGMDAIVDDVAAVSTPQLEITSAAVVRALSDFEALVSSKGGAVSGVDRIHTALHAYLGVVCDEARISRSDDADITTLFRLIREKHPALQNYPPGQEVQKILRALATIVDALNPVRNKKSMAHPSVELLAEPEAVLAANAVKSLLHYLNSKLV